MFYILLSRARCSRAVVHTSGGQWLTNHKARPIQLTCGVSNTHHLPPQSHSPLAYSSHPSHNHLHQHHTTNTPTSTIIIIIFITSFTIHLLTPHTTHGSDIIHTFQHKSSPSFNNHEVSNAMPFTHSPPSFTRHTYRTSTTATSINNNDVYQEDSTKQNKSTQTL